MRRSRDPRQLNLFDWSPPTATILTHPAVWRAVWQPRLSRIADRCEKDEAVAQSFLGWGVQCLGEDLVRAGANEQEAAREMTAFRQALTAELARRRNPVRKGPGAA